MPTTPVPTRDGAGTSRPGGDGPHRVPWPAKFGALALIWGASFFFMKIGLRSLAPLQISGLRIFSGAAVLVALLAASRGRLPRDRAVWAHLVVSAFFLCTLPFSLFALGEERRQLRPRRHRQRHHAHRHGRVQPAAPARRRPSAGARSSGSSWASSASW